jgi:pilus assembly protein TadC
MSSILILKFIFLVLLVIVVLILLNSNTRTASDVLNDLEDYSEFSVRANKQNTQSEYINSINETSNILFGTPLEGLIIDPKLTSSYNKILRKYLVLSTFFAILIVLPFANSLKTFIPVTLIGFSAGYLLFNFKIRKLKTNLVQELEYLLPVVMERLTMAVQSGLDVIAAINTIIRSEEELSDNGKLDLVSELLKIVLKLTDSGFKFSDALKQVAQAVPVVPIRHAFVHLSLAYEDGGELVSSLSELSESTQVYYQETVEERIAKLPAKATFPLVLIFAGLIVFFITMPLMQLMSIISSMSVG